MAGIVVGAGSSIVAECSRRCCVSSGADARLAGHACIIGRNGAKPHASLGGTVKAETFNALKGALRAVAGRQSIFGGKQDGAVDGIGTTKARRVFTSG